LASAIQFVLSELDGLPREGASVTLAYIPYPFEVTVSTQDDTEENPTHTLSSADATQYNHVAWQRHSANSYTVHYKGQLVISYETTSARDLSDGIDGQININAQNISGVGLSQIRISNSALYGTGTFTPPTEAFYDSTP
jgi:hypothetical protein